MPNPGSFGSLDTPPDAHPNQGAGGEAALRSELLATQASKDRLLAALDGLGQHLCLLDEIGKVLWVNRPWQDFAVANRGDPARCGVGTNYLAQCLAADADRHPEARQFAQRLGEVLSGRREHFGLEYPCHAPDRQRWFVVRVRGFDDGGQRRAIVAHEEITAQRHASNELQLAQNSLHAAAVDIFWVRADGTIADCNPQACRSLGYAPGELVGRKVWAIDACHTEAQWPLHWADLEQHGRLVFTSRQRRRDGSERDISVAATLLHHQGELLNCAFVIDITEQRRTQAALASSESRYRQLFEAAPDAAFLIAAEGPDAGRILDANSAAATMHGYSRDELLGMPIGTLDVPDDAQAVGRRLHELLDQGAVRFEVRHRRRDGSEFPVEVSARLVTVDGRACAISFNRDISERVQSQQALRDHQLRLELAAQASGIGFWDWNLDTGEVYFSPEWQAQIGYQPGEVPHRYEEWERRVHPEDLPGTLRTVAGYLADPTGVYVSEFRFRHKDGTYRWILARGQVLLGANGKPQRMVGCHVDLTDRRAVEAKAREVAARMQTIYETGPQCIKTVDAAGHLLEMNPIGLQLIEADALEQVRGCTVTDLIHPEDRAAYLALHQRVVAGGSGTLEFRIQGLKGTGRWMETHSVPLRDRDGAITAVLSVTRDISERRRAEVEREAMARQIQQLQKLEAVGTLSGGIAHDFNNILTAIAGNLELAMLETAPEAPQQEHLREVQKAADRARALVRQILTFSRSLPADRRPVALQSIVAEAASFLRATIPQSVAIETELADVPPVLADAGQIHQVLVNLGTNGWHAMEDRPGRLRFRLETVSLAAPGAGGLPAGGYARLTVQDDGSGMPPAVVQRIFEPFFTTKPAGKGTGLGLSVVHGIVQAHGGSIRVDSAPGRGTTFTIDLPLAPTAAGAPAEPVVAPRGLGQHLLLVDDEVALGRVLARGLERHGYRVSVHADPEAALAALASAPRRCDLLITDYDMPGLQGLALVARARALRHDLPVLLCSGFLKPEVIEAAKAAGVSRVLVKPFATAELAAAVGELLPRPGQDARR